MKQKNRIKENLQERAQEFWKWFLKNETQLYDFEKNQEVLFQSLSQKLYSVHPSLGFAFHEEIQDGKREMILSPNGDSLAVPFLNSLYTSKPALERWVITKYKPRIDVSDSFEPFLIGDVTCDPNGVTFVLFAKETKIYIIFFVEGFEDKTKKDAMQTGIIILMDQLIGEYNAMTHIGDVWVQPANAPFEKGKKYPIKYLPLAFDETLKKINEKKVEENK